MILFRVSVSKRAADDLLYIWIELGRLNHYAADKLLDRLTERINTLYEMPRRGLSRPSLGKGMRSLLEGEFIIYYRVTGEEVEILRVVNAARDQQKIFS